MMFIEYPKMLYKVEPPHNVTVMNATEEAATLKDGWHLAEDFFSDPPQSLDPGAGEAPSNDDAPGVPVPRRSKKRK